MRPVCWPGQKNHSLKNGLQVTKEVTMSRTKNSLDAINDYIAAFPKEVQKILKDLRKTIKTAVPDAEERISYEMPAFSRHGNSVYFAAYKNHISFYPGESGIRAFQKELSEYQGGRGAVRFPIDKPLPLTLIRKIAKFKVTETVSAEFLP